jgi:hypothetical protein
MVPLLEGPAREQPPTMQLLINRKLAAGMAIVAVLASSYPGTLHATTVTGIVSPEALAMADTIRPQFEVERGTLIVEEAPAIDIWLAKLAFQESAGKHNIKVLDVNGKYSYGCLQFQEGTFRNYALKYGFISRSTPTESRIYDCDLQKKLAKLMLAENYSNWRAWYTSAKKSSVGLPPKA